MPVKHIHSDSEFNALFCSGNATGDRLFLVDYSAKWCGPCKMIAPIFSQMSDTYGHANFQFIHVDVDECKDVSEEQGVRALPTFVFYKNTTECELARLQGADTAALESKVKELAPKFQAHFGGQGNKLGGGGTAPPSASGSNASSSLSADEIVQIAQANVEYGLSTCCRVGFRFLPAPNAGGGVFSAPGYKPFLRINPTEKISKLREFVDAILEYSGVSNTSYELHNSYPPGKLDESIGIGDGGVAGAVVVVKFV